MAKPRPRKKPEQTWSGLDEGDVTGAEEAEEAHPMTFDRRSKAQPAEPEPTPEEQARCRKRKR
jgi:hypothetical protein